MLRGSDSPTTIHDPTTADGTFQKPHWPPRLCWPATPRLILPADGQPSLRPTRGCLCRSATQCAVMSDIHEDVFTRDQLIAELSLENRETSARQNLRTEAVSVNLMA